jgi:arginyl-tRNA synthetase
VASLEPSERDILMVLSTYEGKVAEAARDHSPAVIANYMYELAKEYNQFYQSVPIFNESDSIKLGFRLALSEKVGLVVKHGMSLLGIEVPERM